jgi:hypothetical protein
MDATDKMTERVLEWFRKHAPEDGVRIYDDNDGVSIGVDGRINICKFVAFVMHGDATHTPGLPPELAGTGVAQQDQVQAALQNLPKSLLNDKATAET